MNSNLKNNEHLTQLNFWDNEHKECTMFPCVDSGYPDPGVMHFWAHIKDKIPEQPNIVDMCCGKGRNAIWLAQMGAKVFAFDSSDSALSVFSERVHNEKFSQKIKIIKHDAIEKWPYSNNSMDVVVDSFGSSDIESDKGRYFIANEVNRVLRPDGFYFLQIDSLESGYFKEMYDACPGNEPNTICFPNGKVESVLSDSDIENWDKRHPLKLIESRTLTEASLVILGKPRCYSYYWIIAQKV